MLSLLSLSPELRTRIYFFTDPIQEFSVTIVSYGRPRIPFLLPKQELPVLRAWPSNFAKSESPRALVTGRFQTASILRFPSSRYSSVGSCVESHRYHVQQIQEEAAEDLHEAIPNNLYVHTTFNPRLPFSNHNNSAVSSAGSLISSKQPLARIYIFSISDFCSFFDRWIPETPTLTAIPQGRRGVNASLESKLAKT